MSVAKIIEISSTSNKSFEDAVQQGIRRASGSVHGIRSAWVKELRVDVSDNAITDYQVNMLLTFVLDEPASTRNQAGGTRRRARAR